MPSLNDHCIHNHDDDDDELREESFIDANQCFTSDNILDIKDEMMKLVGQISPNNTTNDNKMESYSILLSSIPYTVVLAILENLITIDRYIYGEWTYIAFAIGFMSSAFSVYYAQQFVRRFGVKCTLTMSTMALMLLIMIHYSRHFLSFQMAIILFAFSLGPFYAAQLQLLSNLHQLLFSPSPVVGHFIYL
ncbi:hypothetical protein BLA29_010022, partial [Euroglyphus maynei]